MPITTLSACSSKAPVSRTQTGARNNLLVLEIPLGVKKNFVPCCTKVIMSGVNDKVIMSGCGDDDPDDERREAARGNTKSV
jgi:hypothetical protein